MQGQGHCSLAGWRSNLLHKKKLIMPENEFEKQVQQKMNELQFVPSAVVWSEVEKQIAERKKRRLIFIWLPFLLLLLAGSVWLNHSGSAIKTNKQIIPAEKNTPLTTENKKPETIESSKPVSKTETKKSSANLATVIKKNKKNEKLLLSSKENIKTSAETIATITVHKKNILSQSHFKEQAAINKNNENTYNKSRTAITKNSSRSNQVSNNTLALRKADDKTTDKLQKKFYADEDAKIENITASKNENNKPAGYVLQDNKLADEPVVNDSATADNKPYIAKADVKDRVNNKRKPDSTKALTKTKSVVKKRKIEWGINFDAGVSKIFNGFSGLLSSVPSYDPRSYTASQLNNSPTAGTVMYASDVKTGFAFAAGILVSKDVRKNLKLMTGLNYNYFSTGLQTGSKIDSNKSAVQYRTGNSTKYVNQFHFIEVPLIAEKQFGSASHFSVDAGLAFSILTGSNTLQYDGQRNIYYVDNSRINKTQWSLLGGFNYKVSQKKLKVEIGPQINYNLSNIFQKQLYGSRHLFFAGIGTKIFF
jgi:hypothetical protein